jgi:hypothetical protein
MSRFRVPDLKGFGWQETVKGRLADDPGGATKGDRYLVIDSDGDWAGHDNEIAWFDGADWQFDPPQDGWVVYSIADKKHYKYDADTTSWVEFPTISEEMAIIYALIF